MLKYFTSMTCALIIHVVVGTTICMEILVGSINFTAKIAVSMMEPVNEIAGNYFLQARV